jgi:hypothetical protein
MGNYTDWLAFLPMLSLSEGGARKSARRERSRQHRRQIEDCVAPTKAPLIPQNLHREVEVAKNHTDSTAGRSAHPLFETLGAATDQAQIFAYSVKVVCGKQTESGCCCVAGVRPGVYSTEVNIQNINLVTATVGKLVLPLINSGAVIAREPNIADAATFERQIDTVKLPPLAATMDDCCRIAELLLGAAPSGETPLTIAILTIVSLVELSVSAVYTASPLTGDGVSIDVEYIPARLLRRG